MPTSQLHATVGMRGEYEEKISLHFCRERERERQGEKEKRLLRCIKRKMKI
jgi:hypothetical protein